MFCSKCGANVPEGNSFCTSCGTPLVGTMPTQQPIQQPFQQPMYSPRMAPMMTQVKKTSGAGIIAAIITIIVMLGAAAFVFFVWKPFASYSPKGVVEKFFDAFLDGNTDKMEECMAPYCNEKMPNVSSSMGLISAFGMKISYKVGTYSNYSGSDFEAFCRDIRSEYGYDTDNIQEAGQVDVTLKMTGSFYGESMDDSDEETVVVVKIGGKWYIANTDFL